MRQPPTWTKKCNHCLATLCSLCHNNRRMFCACILTSVSHVIYISLLTKDTSRKGGVFAQLNIKVGFTDLRTQYAK